jgi:hypothetical protein
MRVRAMNEAEQLVADAKAKLLAAASIAKAQAKRARKAARNKAVYDKCKCAGSCEIGGRCDPEGLQA